MPQEVAFLRCFSHQSELTLFEISKAPVNELRGLARRSGCEVVALDEADLHAARGSVQRDPGTGDASADDEEVEFRSACGLELLERGVPAPESESAHPTSPAAHLMTVTRP